MRMAFFRRQRTVRVDRHQGRAATLSLLRARPEMYAGGDGVRAPENNQFGLLGQFHVDADASAEGDFMAGSSGRRTDGAIEETGTQLVEESHGHRFALHQPHGARVAVGQNLLRIFRRQRRESVHDGRDRGVPVDGLEASLAFLADASHGMQQPVRMVRALGIACHFGTQDARGRPVLRSSGHLDCNTVLDVNLKPAGVGTVVGAGAFDYSHRRWRACGH